MPERAIIDWTGPDGRPEARLYSRWSPPAQQIPALADFLSAGPYPNDCNLTVDSLGELFATAAQLIAGQALRIRALTEAFPRPPYAAYLADPNALEAAAVRHEANAAAAGWWPEDHTLLDPAHSNQ